MLDAVTESVTSVSRLVMMGPINKPMHVLMIVPSPNAVMATGTSALKIAMMAIIYRPMHVSMIVHSLDVVMDIITSTWRLAMMAIKRMPTTAPTHVKKQLVVMESFMRASSVMMATKSIPMIAAMIVSPPSMEAQQTEPVSTARVSS